MSEWFGALPSHWQIMKINSLFSERREKVSDTDFAPLSVSKGGVVPQIATVAKTNAGDNRKRVCVGDYAINSRSDRRGSSGVSQHDGSVSLINIVLTPRGEHNSRFFHYLLRSHNFIEEYYRNGRGIVADLWTTRYTEMKGIYLPLPPRAEQDQIVRYLDWKVSQVNRLINAKKKQIGLLLEQKRAAINAAVTKGLNPDAPTKDSDVEWLGEVPDHWTIMPSKALFREGKETRRQDDEPAAATQRYGIMLQREYMNLENRRIVAAFSNLEQWKHVDVGDFVISLRSFQGGLELSTIVACVTWHYIILKNNMEIDSSYYKYLFKSESYINALRQTSDYIRDGQDLRYSHFTKVPLPYFSKQEQAEISACLNKQCAVIDSLITSLEKEITFLHEYRTRLISDVVTGKMDVRRVAVPEFEAVEEAATEDGIQDEGETTDTEEE